MNKADSEKKSQIESEAHSVLSKRYRLFKEIFTRQHFALNVAHLSYRESKLWERTFNWKPPKNRE
jgi:hypothetical protein